MQVCPARDGVPGVPRGAVLAATTGGDGDHPHCEGTPPSYPSIPYTQAPRRSFWLSLVTKRSLALRTTKLRTTKNGAIAHSAIAHSAPTHRLLKKKADFEEKHFPSNWHLSNVCGHPTTHNVGIKNDILHYIFPTNLQPSSVRHFIEFCLQARSSKHCSTCQPTTEQQEKIFPVYLSIFFMFLLVRWITLVWFSVHTPILFASLPMCLFLHPFQLTPYLFALTRTFFLTGFFFTGVVVPILAV